MEYLTTIGLEVHVQLRTDSKMFCACPNRYGAAPNEHTCPVCLGYPGVLPVPNLKAIEWTMRTGMMLGCRIARYSKFDRKSYFYPDMPKNYQISQYDLPLCEGGYVEVDLESGGTKRIGITRIHLEEDVAKSTHHASTSAIDFNRAGTPLMEIVTEPDIESPEEAYAFLTSLKQILTFGGVSDCNMEKGNIRCDANISVRPAGQLEFGVKTEIKNMNTFSGAQRALAYEVERQCAVLNSGGRIEQETRRWDDVTGTTELMRSKEYAHDYRYFPDPDLMPMVVDDAWIGRLEEEVPELPRQRRARFEQAYGISGYDAGVLTSSPELAGYYESAVEQAGDAKLAANFINNLLLGARADAGMEIESSRVLPEHIAGLVNLVVKGTISSQIAKEVFAVVFETGRAPDEVVKERGLVQVQDTGAILDWVQQAIEENPGPAADFIAGREKAIGRLVGAVMKASQGKANPKLVNEVLREELNRRRS
jgi:aspartyl-tRNA(Asn)/glutamyl-tRNA(Gln) amidotransferase subunit B